jgi:hypothetical protein
MKKGQPVRLDYEYERNSTANMFMMFAPLEGWRHVEVTERRTAIDYAHVLKDLSDVHFPGAKIIVLVQDNLNTHLYEAFTAIRSAQPDDGLPGHHAPKHGSWLDLAESELGVLASKCLDRRIPDQKILIAEVVAWQCHRNRHHAKCRLAFHNRKGPRQTQTPLPFTLSESGH